MTAVHVTAAQAKKLGITNGIREHVERAGPPARTTRRPRSPYRTTCHDCGETFTTQASETRHLDTTRHCRYQLDLVRAPT